MKDLLHNRWVKFGFWAVLYTAWVIWLGNFWWLFGLIVVFDLYITKKVKWAFWKKNYKEGEKHNVFLDWLDAIIFAVIVVTFINMFFVQSFVIPTSSMEKSLMTGDYLFVGKLAYGPKVAERPLSIPFVHNSLPNGKKSYSDLIKIDYRRLAGFSEVKRDDKVVFGFPHGDSVLQKCPTDDYYTHLRLNGKDYTHNTYGPVIVRPVDKKDNYVKRCVAIAGDTLQIIDGKVYVNGTPQKSHSGIQNTYTVVTNGTSINSKILDDMDINPKEFWFDASLPGYRSIPLNEENVAEIEKLANVVKVEQNIDSYPPDYPDSYLMIFPFSMDFPWTRDNYGPIYIPAKDATVEINISNLPLYQRIISVYEKNSLEVKDGQIVINGEVANSYTFKQDYYFMMGDNRHNSLDSRYWGFVPEDHIVGKPRVIWFSSDKNKSFPQNIRWNRLFKFV